MMKPGKPVLSVFVAAMLCSTMVFCGCESSSGSRRTDINSSGAEQLAAAREAATVAAGIAVKAERARARDKDDEATQLSRKAIEEYRRALSLSPDMPEVWNNLGVELMRIQDYLGASEAFGMAMQLSPTDPRPAENLGLVYHRTGWAEESLRYYDMALERSPNYLPALRGAIKASHLLGEADEKRLEQVRRALMIEPDPKMREFFEREQVRILGRLERHERRG